ncbi:MAG: hypothetical protein AAB914_01800 [Patescibacteria group bacterium]
MSDKTMLFGEHIEQRQKTVVAAGIDANTIYKVKPGLLAVDLLSAPNNQDPLMVFSTES